MPSSAAMDSHWLLRKGRGLRLFSIHDRKLEDPVLCGGSVAVCIPDCNAEDVSAGNTVV